MRFFFLSGALTYMHNSKRWSHASLVLRHFRHITGWQLLPERGHWQTKLRRCDYQLLGDTCPLASRQQRPLVLALCGPDGNERPLQPSPSVPLLRTGPALPHDAPQAACRLERRQTDLPTHLFASLDPVVTESRGIIVSCSQPVGYAGCRDHAEAPPSPPVGVNTRGGLWCRRRLTPSPCPLGHPLGDAALWDRTPTQPLLGPGAAIRSRLDCSELRLRKVAFISCLVNEL
ncbi:hypothetical protein E2C01_081350 [Portunus trituberculatus]|uniref:Uncharacterized protein n=1 Tax=Portunus trituberculatus TaxID=210409 RepID=A0A5B7IPJ3_PORTR|nr:hypothetical protein [Portunus trituberculatus]